MEIFTENQSLKNYNTFGINVKARYFYSFAQINEFRNFIRQRCLTEKKFILGGGSNILFLNDFDGLIIQPLIKGINIVKQTAEHIYICAGAGENWDDFVNFCVNNNYGGAENLSLIPGTVGAAPVQNIGAYGVEVKDIIVEVAGLNLKTLEEKTFSAAQCNFGYRTSIFKNKLKEKFLITSVTFRLSKRHKFITNYGNIEDELKKYSYPTRRACPERSRMIISPKAVPFQDAVTPNSMTLRVSLIRKAIINIRKEKLPDIASIGNAGSFFKNPAVSQSFAMHLKEKFSDAPVFPFTKNKVKLSAAWLIEKCGWKGKRVGNAGVYKKHALIIVNYGNATGAEIYSLAKEISSSVQSKFNILLEPEIVII